MKRIIISLFDETGTWPCGFEGDDRYLVKRYDLNAVNPDYRCDVRLLTRDELMEGGFVWAVLSASPCTVFAASGACHPRSDDDIRNGLSCIDATFRIIYATRPLFWALENPVGKLKSYIGQWRNVFDPCDYGDPYTKKTLLWGNYNMPPKTPVPPTQGSKMHKMRGGPNTQRSQTPLGSSLAFYQANCEYEQFDRDPHD